MGLPGFEAMLRRIGIDRYMMALILTVVLAALLPARGAVAGVLSQLTFWVVALLFFLYGAKLSLAATWAAFDEDGREFWSGMDALVDMLDGLTPAEDADA